MVVWDGMGIRAESCGDRGERWGVLQQGSRLKTNLENPLDRTIHK